MIPGNQPRASLPRKIRPDPFAENCQPVPKPDEQIDMDKGPKQPGRKTGNMSAEDNRHGPMTAYCGKCSPVLVSEDASFLPPRSHKILSATARPSWVAAAASPGMRFPCPCSSIIDAISPIAKTSGLPGRLDPRSTVTRPALSGCSDNNLASGEAATPDAQIASFTGTHSSPTLIIPGLIPVTMLFVLTWTPSSFNCSSAFSDRSSG